MEDGQTAFIVFQFQNGTIKSERLTAKPKPANYGFQFQNGTIKSVRDYLGQNVVFQFQNGTITSVILDWRSTCNLCFNSKMVQLKADNL